MHIMQPNGLPLLLFLLLSWPSIWSEAHEIDGLQTIPRGEARWTYLRPRWGRPRWTFPGVGILPSPINHDPAISACWAPFRPIRGCSSSLFHWSRSGKIDIGADCCGAVLRLTPDCFYKIFYGVLYRVTGDIGSSVKAYCASQH